jgi:sec-independent protein translocase protein TatA
MPSLGWPELLLLAVVLVMLFGAKKLPDTARALGKSMRIFKSETKAMQADDEQVSTSAQQAGPAQSTTPQPNAQPAPPAQLPAAGSDGTTINGAPLTETERSQKTS